MDFEGYRRTALAKRPPRRRAISAFGWQASEAGESIRYRIRLYLPPSAGNDTQNKQAVVDFVWRAAAP